jgi:hypothetical protein
MNMKWMMNLTGPMLAFCMTACMTENPAGRGANAGDNLAVAARQPIGSTEGVTNISTLAQLRAMRTTGNYKLINNIDASATANTPFVPVGFTKDPFQGTFDGGIYTIDKLNINASGENTGMFSWAVNAKLKNIHLTNVTIAGGRNTGAIAGYASNVDLTDSYVTGTVTGKVQGDSRLGLVFGSTASFVRIARCYATGTVTGWGKYVGGFIGYANATGIQDPNDEFRLMVQEVFVNVTVNPTLPSGTSAVYAGGLIGHLTGGWIEDVNAVVNVTGRTAAGGILGYVVNDDPNSLQTYIRPAISRGVVTDAATPQRAGTIGMAQGSMSECSTIWDKDTDTGNPNPNFPPPLCQVGISSNELKAAHPAPNKWLKPYIIGTFVDQAFINQNPGTPACKLGSGSDDDWGFGTCGSPVKWNANSATEYITLARIPNPSVQPK